MKNIILSFFVLLFITMPLPIPWVNGVYNKVSGLFWCSDKNSCIHEIGHKLDDEAGWISKSREFENVIEIYLGGEVKRGFLGNHMTEIYARLFERSGGVSENMPELLRPYYDWERAAELMEYYEVNDE